MLKTREPRSRKPMMIFLTIERNLKVLKEIVEL
jgi:hypothetical protein